MQLFKSIKKISCSDTKARIGAGLIIGGIVGLVMLTIFFSMMPDLIFTSATSIKTLSDMYAGNSTTFGASASTIGGKLDDYTGYFWVLGPLILAIVVILKVFSGGRR